MVPYLQAVERRVLPRGPVGRDSDVPRGDSLLGAQDDPRRRLHLLQELLHGSQRQNVSYKHFEIS